MEMIDIFNALRELSDLAEADSTSIVFDASTELLTVRFMWEDLQWGHAFTMDTLKQANFSIALATMAVNARDAAREHA